MYSSTSSGEPIATGDRWWMLLGWMSRMVSKPVEAMPPACSMMKAMGLPSYSRRSFEGRQVMRKEFTLLFFIYKNGSQISVWSLSPFHRGSSHCLGIKRCPRTSGFGGRPPPWSQCSELRRAQCRPAAIYNVASLRRLNRSTFENKVRLLKQQRYLRELLLLQILCNSRLKVFGVTFVQAVDLAALLDPYIPIDQDKFADWLTGKEKETWHRSAQQRVQQGFERVLTGSSMKQLTPWPVEITIMVALP